MELKKYNYQIEIDKSDMKVFEEKMLFSGLCDFIVPMRFTDIGAKRKITYDCSGYVAIRDMKITSAREVFEILEKTLLTLNKSVEFFIPHDKVKLTIDTVYYDMTKKRVRIAYMPSEEPDLNKNLNCFINELKRIAGEETCEYLQSVQEDLNMYNRSLKDMAAFVAEQRKRIKRCGVE